MLSAICANTGRSANATLIHCELQPTPIKESVSINATGTVVDPNLTFDLDCKSKLDLDCDLIFARNKAFARNNTEDKRNIFLLFLVNISHQH
ncbi:MAG: hypothetical protein NVS1B11_31430 [Terriglobales bacterium]